MKRIVVTGGTGYIGSHVAVELANAGYSSVILDNGHNSQAQLCLKNIKAVASRESNAGEPSIELQQVDLVDAERLSSVFESYKSKGGIYAVIHLAAWKAVGESGEKPLEYYLNNVAATLNLLKVMRDTGVVNLVYSSSATVYGEPDSTPIPETAQLRAESTYARTKVYCENILMDVTKADPSFTAVALRYFNPGGAHPCGEIGEDPQGRPNNLLPLLAAIAVGRIPNDLKVFGDDFPTPDGTCLRDYLHVVDLARGHVKALDVFAQSERAEFEAGTKNYRPINLGTGRAYSVLEMIAAMRKASGFDYKVTIAGRRFGDVPDLTSDPRRAAEELRWSAEKGLEDMCKDLWNWQSKHPAGYTAS